MKIKLLFLCGLILCSISLASELIDLSGTWRFALDYDSVGHQQNWFSNKLPGNDIVNLPGSLQEQGYGKPAGVETDWTGDIRQDQWGKSKYLPYRTKDNFKVPFWLQADKYYKGAAWYQKQIEIPQSWDGKRIVLNLERPHWESSVWIDSIFVGSNNYLSTNHIYDLTKYLSTGSHTLTIRVDNREVIPVGINSHSISDHTQSNWNGIIGEISLTAEPIVWFDNIQAYPDITSSTAHVKVSLGNGTDKVIYGKLSYDIYIDKKKVWGGSKSVKIDNFNNAAEFVVRVGDNVKIWDEFNPNLYTLKLDLETQYGTTHRETVFGMREVRTEGTRIVLNDRNVYMRGTLECCIFPKTGYPPTDIESWKRIIKTCKAHGLNHIRFHSWCPPKAAFIAADELGFYYQVECSSWCNQGTSVGDGRPVDKWLYDEADAIIKAYGNHPSFLLFAYGNEPGGSRQEQYLGEWVTHYRNQDHRRLVTSGSGWPLISQNDYHVTHQGTRIQGWGQGLNSRINSKSPETVTDYRKTVGRYPNHPMVAHEIGQWCVYPNFDEIKKYNGVLKAKNFEIFRDLLKDKNMLGQAHDFLMASGKLQTLCYKEDIESDLRTDGFGGFQLLDLHDFPGQGTALVGVLDPFWDSKPYVSPKEYSRFCNAIVPLIRMPKRILTASETFIAEIEISHFGPDLLENAKVVWELLNDKGRQLKKATLKAGDLASGGLYKVGEIKLILESLPAPAKYTLQVSVAGTDAVNDWDIWVYPDAVSITAPKNIMIATDIDDAVKSHLQKGGKVMLTLDPDRIETDIKIGFSSIFWNTAWTGGQAPHTLGILCDPEYPALAEFPTEYHSNWQWSDIMQNSAVMEMDLMPKGLRPVVQVVPDWFNPKKIGLVFEAKVGSGSLLVTSIDMTGNIENRPVARQLKHSLLKYLESDTFKPEFEIELASINAFLRQPSVMEKLGARVNSSNIAEPGHEGDNLIDDDPKTLWHSRWSEDGIPYPHFFHLELKNSVEIVGFKCLPRQDGNRNGWIKKYSVYVSEDPKQWGNPVASGEFDNSDKLKKVIFKKPAKGKYVRFVSQGGFGSDTYSSMAEFELMTK